MSHLLQPDERGWLNFDHSVLETPVNIFREFGVVEKLSVTKTRHFGIAEARRLQACKSIKRLWLWVAVTRGALRELFQTRELEVVDVLALGAGKLRGIDRANSLKILRCNCRMTEDDLVEISRSQSLEELGAQHAKLNVDVLEGLMRMPNLRSVDFEATKFDDQMAKTISRSHLITHLDIGATRVTRKGLSAICEMKQLKSLDLWATALSANDLELLRLLPNLEYVSIGNYSHEDCYESEQIVRLVTELPTIKKVWLDGIRLSAEQEQRVLKSIPDARLT